MFSIDGYSVYTLLVKRHDKTYGNQSDDGVDNYEYDYVIENGSDNILDLVSRTGDFLKYIGVEVDENRYIEESYTGNGE